jgi:myosin-5
MEVNAQVWLRRESSHWGWVPAVIYRKEEVVVDGQELINLTLIKDRSVEGNSRNNKRVRRSGSEYFSDEDDFEVVIQVDPEQLKTADHDDVKLRNLPSSFQASGADPEAGVLASPSTHVDAAVVGGVDDLIGLTHLHEPAILHALRLRYDADIIYTATGPILIAINPFKPMDLYTPQIMERYRQQGEQGVSSSQSESPVKFSTPFAKPRRKEAPVTRLPPHVYQTADDAYRQMLRGLENKVLMQKPQGPMGQKGVSPTNQSILVSGESGAGKTVTTKIVLNYLAMLSKKRSQEGERTTPTKSPRPGTNADVSIEQQVLQSNPILEAFGNARTIRNDNSSRFGKYIDISFTKSGKLSGASIETYLLEKVRLIHPSPGERNYHVFYQFLKAATARERQDFYVGNKTCRDFRLLSDSGTYDRRDGVSDEKNHFEMLEAMVSLTDCANYRTVIGRQQQQHTHSYPLYSSDHHWILTGYHPFLDEDCFSHSVCRKHELYSIQRWGLVQT